VEEDSAKKSRTENLLREIMTIVGDRTQEVRTFSSNARLKRIGTLILEYSDTEIRSRIMSNLQN
jgi:hypothetical protein